MTTTIGATVEDLYRAKGKAEIVSGRLVHFMPTGRMPAFAAGEIFVSLRVFVRSTNLPGIVVPDNAGFTVDLPTRGSFSLDVAYYEGPNSGMRFFEGAPTFAVEVRSENDYGPAQEQEMSAKRRDYFMAGADVVWDVDLLGRDVVRKYVAPNADEPACVFLRGEQADAEPAVPGWSMSVDDLFESS